MFEVSRADHTIHPSLAPEYARMDRQTLPVIARLDHAHLEIIEQFFLETDRDSCINRFGSVLSPAAIQAYVRTTVAGATLLLGVFQDRKLRGLLEALHCGGRDMEVALLVQQAWQRQGLGSALLDAAVAHGASIRANRYRLIFSTRNWAMRRIAQKSNARLDIVFDEMQADIELPVDLGLSVYDDQREIRKGSGSRE